MKRDIGPIVQVAYVVSDIIEAAHFWTGLGMGPIYIHRWETNACYGGNNVKFTADFGFGYSGGLQLELIQQITDVVSPYHSAVAAGSFQTLHHIGIGSNDTFTDARRMEADGHPIVFGVESAYGYFSYHDVASQSSGLIELLPMTMLASEPFRQIKMASHNWNGLDPIRDGKKLFQ